MDRWQHISQLYHAALARDASERAAFLAGACGGDEKLRREVESLLAHEGTAEGFLAAPALEMAVKVMAENSGQSLTGRQIGAYHMLSLLGAGGMGEVYRARDTKLGREVAVKVLPPSFAHDPERLVRFEREARLLAALNHPHIGAIYGLLEEFDHVRGLVLELVEGPTLADRVTAGSLPVQEALTVARQIAEALEAAHEKGIIHRDLKPANIKVTLEGTVKVLDFGLAKAWAGNTAGVDLSKAPTVTATAPREGVLLGTPAYMSPEQARGQAIDTRTDIWSFGCVLYEMLTGKQPFRGSTITDVLAAILEREPDWQALPATLPSNITTIVRKCLEKDPRRRLRDIGDARIELEDTLTGASTRTVADKARAPVVRRAIAVAVAAGLALGAVAAWMTARSLEPGSAPPRPVARFAVNLSPNEIVDPVRGNSVAVSRDGTRVAVVGNSDGRTQIYVRSVGELSAKPVPGTEGGSGPFFSPDGQWLGFRHAGSRTIRKVALSGGASVTICPYNAGYGASWELDDTILFNGDVPGGILRVPAAGGVPQAVTELDSQDRNHYWPELLPGGEAVLFSAARADTDTIDDGRVEIQLLATRERRVLVEGGGFARYSPTGHLLYARRGTLLAVPFDVKRLVVTGLPVPVLEGLSMSLNTATAHFGLSANGTLAYAPGPAVGGERTVLSVNRQGKAERLPLPPRSYLHPRISPDGRQIAIEIEGPNHNLYTYDLGRGVLSRVALEGFDGNNHWPVWTPGGERLTFRTFGPGGFTMWWMPADRSGPPERLTNIGINQSASSWAPDGKVVAFTQVSSETGPDVYVLPINDRKPHPFAQTRFAEGSPKFSPDGRWIAYTSRESGGDEIYVQAYPGPGPKIQVSTEGGTDGIWKRTGGELFYRNGDKMMAVAVSTQPTFTASTPRMLWEGRYAQGMSSACGPPGPTSSNYDVTADGQRFLMIKDSDTESFPSQINVVLNWTEELKQRLQQKK